MPSIFLSHSSKDKDFVRYLAAKLINAQVTVWIDEAELKIGDSLIEKIGRAIEEIDYFGVILTTNSVNSEWVQRELRVALMREFNARDVTVLPILVEPVQIPPFLRDKVYADFTPGANHELSFAKLLLSLQAPVAPTVPSRPHAEVLDLSKNEGFQEELRSILLNFTDKRAYFSPAIPSRILGNALRSCSFYDQRSIICVLDYTNWFWSMGKTVVIFARSGIAFGGSSAKQRVNGFIEYHDLPSTLIHVTSHFHRTERGSSVSWDLHIAEKSISIGSTGPSSPREFIKIVEMLKMVIPKWLP